MSAQGEPNRVDRPSVFAHALHLTSTLAALIAGLTAAYFLTAFLFARFHWRPPEVVVQVVNSLLGLILIVAVTVVIGVMFRKGKRKPFATITDALERIAKGDFSTRVEEGRDARGPFVELVQSVNQMAVQLDQMEKMRQEFISNVSHEIQSPLTSIRGFACALREKELNAEQRGHYLDVIDAEGTRLSRLTANLLKLACEPQWSAKQIELDVSLEEATVTADEDLLSQVWMNLIHNAIKFTDAGGHIRVALRRLAEGVEVTVADTGIGIAEEDRPRIFERFYKADKARNREGGGSGLGLAIAQKAVAMHRGSIEVQSQAGAGATFLIKLPAV